MKKLISILAVAVMAIFLCASVSAETYQINVTDTKVMANEKIELNDIDDGLRQAVNDVIADNKGCKVTFVVSGDGFFSEGQAMLIGNDYFKQTVAFKNGEITFDWDSFTKNTDMWGKMFTLKFVSSTPLTIEKIYVDVPVQTIVEISAGAGATEKVIPIE